MLSQYSKVSGELTYRTNLFCSSIASAESSLISLPTNLHKFLQKETSNYDEQIRMLKMARMANKERRQRRRRILDEQKVSAAAVARSKFLEVIQGEDGRSAKMENLIKVLHSRLTILSLLYFKIVEADRALCMKRVAYESFLVDQTHEKMKVGQRLALFCLHIQHETRGSVVVKRLQSSHPQFLRCERAATENVKKDFFSSSDCKYCGVVVENVFKIENRILLDAFQGAAAGSDPGKVKGLFCGVPSDAVEKLIVYGVGSSSGRKGAFQESWYDYKSGGGGATTDAGAAKRAVDNSSTIPFPRCFSRHSTLEEDREFVKKGQEGAIPGTDSSIRFLALCRVMIGKINVIGKNSKGFPHVTDGSYDSMYSPMQEEYKLLNEEYILPEFLVQYRFKGRAQGKDRGDEAPMNGDGGVGGTDDIFNIDLSTSVIDGCKFDRKKEKRNCKHIDAFLVTRSIATRSGVRPTREGKEVEGGSGGQRVNNKGSGAIAWTSYEEWIRQRQNAAVQKEAVTLQVRDLIEKSTILARRNSVRPLFVEGSN